MITRIISPTEFEKAIDDMHRAFLEEDINSGHPNLLHDPNQIKNSLANHQLLWWRYPTWGNCNNGSYTSLLVCEAGFNVKFARKQLVEFLWLSKDSRTGIKMFKIAEQYAKENDISMLAFSTVVRHPIHEKIDQFYTKNGFTKDTITYTKII